MKYAVKEELTTQHLKFDGSDTWALTEEGIKVGGGAPERTRGRPITVEAIWNAYHGPINKYSREYRVPVELIVAIIATESRGGEALVTEEPGFQSDTVTPQLVRAGLMQNMLHFAAGTNSVSLFGVRQWLLTPENAIKTGTHLIDISQRETGFDPVLVAAAYRAGGIRQDDSEGNRFKLAQWPVGSSGDADYCDRFIKWFNDFWAVIGKSDIKPAFSLWEHFNGRPGEQFSLPVDLETGLDPTLESLDKYYKHNEQDFVGGYFPVGANTKWHGGVHLMGEEGATVHAIAKGVIVRARMPSDDPKQDDLKYGSRNFVLIRHGTGDNVWYSLYYHLKSVAKGSSEADLITWLRAEELEFKNTVLMWNTAFSTDPDAPPEEKTKEQAKPIHTFVAKDYATIEHEDDEKKGYYVLRPDPSGIRTKGFVYFFEGLMEVGQRAEKVLDSDEVVELNIPVEAGDVIGILGKGVTKGENGIEQDDILHWAVISPRLRPGFLNSVDDGDEDFICDSLEIFDLVDSGLDENDKAELTASEIEDFYGDESRAKKLRSMACRFKSEWAVDWDSQVEPLGKVNQNATAELLKPYNFWDDANGIDKMLPGSGHVWHYNPITYLYRQLFRSARANFSREMFEKNGTFPLPEKSISLLCGIGEWHGDKELKAAYLIGHKGVQGDSGDPVELSRARADAIAAILTLDEAKIGQQIDDGHWGDRERRTMLKWLKTDEGASYYRGNIDKDDPEALETAVKAFQRANGLDPTGNADKTTFAKMFRRMLDIAGINVFEKVETIGAGDLHATATGKPEGCVVEGLFWTTDVEPSPEEYEQEPEATYKEWQAFVREEIGLGLPRSNTTQVLLRRHGLSEQWVKNGVLRDLADGQHLEPDSYVYVYKNQNLWREFRVCEDSRLQEVDLGRYYGQDERPASGDAKEKLELPKPGEDEEMKVEIALAPVQWSWSRVFSFGDLSAADPRKAEGGPKPAANNDRSERLTLIDTAQMEGDNWCKSDQYPDREDLRPYQDKPETVCHVDAPFSLAADSNALIQEAIGDLNECVLDMEEHNHYKSAALAYQLFFNTALHATVAGDDDEYVKQDDSSELLRGCADDMSKLTIEGILQVVPRKGLREKIRRRIAAHAALLAGYKPPEAAGEKTGGRLVEAYPDLISFEAAFEDYAYLTGANYALLWKAFTEYAGNLNFDPVYLDKGNDLHETLEDETDLAPGSWYLEEALTSNERLKNILFPKEDAVDCYSPAAYQPKTITGQETIENAEFRPDAFAAAIAEIAKAKNGPIGTGIGYKSTESGIKMVDKLLSEFLGTFAKQVQQEVEAGSADVREKLVGLAKTGGLQESAGLHVTPEGDVAGGKIPGAAGVDGNNSAAGQVHDLLVDSNGKARKTVVAVDAPDWATFGGKALPTTIAVLEVFNLCVALSVAKESGGADNWVKAGHSFVSVGVAFTEAATAVKGAYFNDLAKHGRGLGRGFGKFATGEVKTSLVKFGSTPGYLSYVRGVNGGLAIIGAVFAFHDATKFTANHDHDAAQASVISGIAQLWLGLATIGVFPGAAPALAVAIIAMVLVMWLSESELERWAKYGPFATKGLGDHYRDMTADEIYAALLTLVRGPKVELKHTVIDELILDGPNAGPRLEKQIADKDESVKQIKSSLTMLQRQTQVPPQISKATKKALTEALNRAVEERTQLERRLAETRKRLADLEGKHGSVTEDTEIMAVEVHAPAWTLGSSIEVDVTVARVDADVTLLERLGTPFPGEYQRPVTLYSTEDIHQGGGSHGPVIGKRYYFQGKPSKEEGYAMRYRARVKHTVEEGVVLPVVWPEDKEKVTSSRMIDYDMPGWIYPKDVLDL